MSTVPNAPDWALSVVVDPLRRRVEFADVFASPVVRAEVAAVAALARRGVLDLAWIAELFADRADGLVDGVRGLDRVALRTAHALLFVEQRSITAAVVEFVASQSTDPIEVHVVDAIGQVVDAATAVDRLAMAWTWFMFGDHADENS